MDRMKKITEYMVENLLILCLWLVKPLMKPSKIGMWEDGNPLPQIWIESSIIFEGRLHIKLSNNVFFGLLQIVKYIAVHTSIYFIYIFRIKYR
jgi:hypothetical protein